ncbi:DUF2851 family protein [Persicobacter psychrovividus]|uniref:DUF2851 domain-containing protein n=1 Tax=Persicobacter psychrovividus TaxID=387638 RepID=A0ABM7VCD9_9BACT|nr:hypothetical protein PEPS_06820 [Persicobacter psychrovividus]
MQEAFLHYIWQSQQFSHLQLTTDDGAPLQVFTPGFINTEAGPDFEQARVKIQQLEWLGKVEIHLKSSDWYEHGHQHDKAYDNVILHVVWENNRPVHRTDGTTIPTLSLKNRTSKGAMEKYRYFLQTDQEHPCKPFLMQVPDYFKWGMIELAAEERLLRKRDLILQYHHKAGANWQQTAFWVMASALGSKLNKEAMTLLVERLSWQKLAKTANQPLTTEAILFGTAGLLQSPPRDNYEAALLEEFLFYQKKLDLHPLPATAWRFARTRPFNFPTIRLAQLATWLAHHPIPLNSLTTSPFKNPAPEAWSLQGSDYWQKHHQFGKPSAKNFSKVGKKMLESISINAIAPFMLAYAQNTGKEPLKYEAIELLEQLSAEDNRILNRWKTHGIKAKNARESQGLIHLEQQYCQLHRCLHCKIGRWAIGKGALTVKMTP